MWKFFPPMSQESDDSFRKDCLHEGCNKHAEFSAYNYIRKLIILRHSKAAPILNFRLHQCADATPPPFKLCCGNTLLKQ